MWTITRVGDVAVTWACALHLNAECEWLQRDYEVTELSVRLFAKAVEVAEINRMIRAGFEPTEEQE